MTVSASGDEKPTNANIGHKDGNRRDTRVGGIYGGAPDGTDLYLVRCDRHIFNAGPFD